MSKEEKTVENKPKKVNEFKNELVFFFYLFLERGRQKNKRGN
jgi:hypothetical protein